MKILKYFLIGFFVFSIIEGQEIQKDGKTPKTFTYAEALEMLKARDAQWEGKLAKADSLIEGYKESIWDCDNIVTELEEQADLDSKVLLAQKKQIELLNEILKELNDIKFSKKIENLENKLIEKFDEKSYSDLIKLKSQINKE